MCTARCRSQDQHLKFISQSSIIIIRLYFRKSPQANICGSNSLNPPPQAIIFFLIPSISECASTASLKAKVPMSAHRFKSSD